MCSSCALQKAPPKGDTTRIVDITIVLKLKQKIKIRTVESKVVQFVHMTISWQMAIKPLVLIKSGYYNTFPTESILKKRNPL